MYRMFLEVSWVEDGEAQIGDGVARCFEHSNKVIQRSKHHHQDNRTRQDSQNSPS